MLTYVLLAAVVFIWAWIMYSVFDFMKDTGPGVLSSAPAKKELQTTDTLYEAEYQLSLQYKDPFLKKEYYSYKTHQYGSTQQRTPAASSNKAVKKPAEEILLPSITYAGRISNAKLKKPVAILIINTTEHMMQEGETVDGITLNKIQNDSVKVLYSKKYFYVRKNP